LETAAAESFRHQLTCNEKTYYIKLTYR